MDNPYLRAWVLPHEIDAERWAGLRQDATRVLRAVSARLEAGRTPADPGILRGPEGLGLPQITEDRIAFNGSAFRGQAGDPFILERRARSGVIVRGAPGGGGRAVRRCNTEGHPYDLAVCALLLTVARRLGDGMRLGSSGGLREGWRAAAAIVRESLGECGQLMQTESGQLRWVDVPMRATELRTRSSA
jgi:hypothetical protein